MMGCIPLGLDLEVQADLAFLALQVAHVGLVALVALGFHENPTWVLLCVQGCQEEEAKQVLVHWWVLKSHRPSCSFQASHNAYLHLQTHPVWCCGPIAE